MTSLDNKSTKLVRLLVNIVSVKKKQGTKNELSSLTDQQLNRLINLAKFHELVPLLYRELTRSTLDELIPEKILKKIERDYYLNISKTTRQSHHFKLLLEKFNDKNINVVLLKGIYLVDNVYTDIGTRPLGDIDILIKEDDFFGIHDLLIDAGYFPRENYEFKRENIFKLVNQFSYYSSKTNQIIDVHLNLDEETTPYKINVNSLWKNIQPYLHEGVPTSTLCLEHHFLHLCIHTTFRHFFLPLRTLIDVEWLLEKNASMMDWDFAETEASKWGAQRCVNLTLEILKEFGCCYPGDYFNKQTSPLPTESVQWMVRQIEKNMLDDKFWIKPVIQFLSSPESRTRTVYLSKGFTRSSSQKPGSRRISISDRLKRFTELIKNYLPKIYYIARHPKETMRFFRLLYWLSR